jgi:hypothetical protein
MFSSFFTTIVHKTKKHKKEIPFSISVFTFVFVLVFDRLPLLLTRWGKKAPKASVKKRSFALLGNFNSLSVSRGVCVCLSLSLHKFCNSPLQDIKYEIHQFWLVFPLPFFLCLSVSLSLWEKKNFLPTTINNCCMLEANKKNSQQVLLYSTQSRIDQVQPKKI